MFGFISSASPTALSRKSASKSAIRRRPRPVLRFESLERREVLSGVTAGLSESLRTQATVDLAIRGTEVAFSEIGLPASMGGDVFVAYGTTIGTNRIGRYEESLTPIFMDINNDQVPDFVGTNGVATFEFFIGSRAVGLIGSITTVNTSYVQGVTPTGSLVVGSQGTIVSGTLALKSVIGGFVSQSTVSLAPSFEMQTSVHFTVNKPAQAPFVLLAKAGASNPAEKPGKHSPIQTSADDDLPVRPGHDNQGPHPKLRQDQKVSTGGKTNDQRGPADSHDSPHERAVDRNFEIHTDWRDDNDDDGAKHFGSSWS